MQENYFTAGDTGQLSEKLQEFVKKPLSVEQKFRQIGALRQGYDWDEIARKTLAVHRKAVEKGGKGVDKRRKG